MLFFLNPQRKKNVPHRGGNRHFSPLQLQKVGTHTIKLSEAEGGRGRGPPSAPPTTANQEIKSKSKI